MPEVHEILNEKSDAYVENAVEGSREILKAYDGALKKRNALMSNILGEFKQSKKIIVDEVRMKSATSARIMENEKRTLEERKELAKKNGVQITEEWIGHVTEMADVTRATFGAAIGSVTNGISEGLVEGTYDWNRAMRGVLKTLISMTLRMIAMKAIAASIGGALGGMGGLFARVRFGRYMWNAEGKSI